MATLPISTAFILKIGYKAAVRIFLEHQPAYVIGYLAGQELGNSQVITDFVIQFAWLWLLVAVYLVHWQQPQKSYFKNASEGDRSSKGNK